MQIYNYDGVTKEFTFESTARLDPLDQLPMVPANATPVGPPPAAGAYQKAVFNVGLQTWNIMEDHRGRSAWSKDTAEPFDIVNLGSLPTSITLSSPEAYEYPIWTNSGWQSIQFPMWDEYLQDWVPDPDAETAHLKEVLRGELRKNERQDAWLFRMILDMFDVGVAKGIWTAADFTPAVKDKAVEWKQKLIDIDSA